MQLTDANIQEIMSQVIAAIGKTKLSEDESQEYIETVQEMLTDYQTHLGQEAEITYRIRKRLAGWTSWPLFPVRVSTPSSRAKVLSDRVKGLATNLEQVKIWANEFMSIVLKLSPLVPFLSVFSWWAKGTSASLLWAGNTWRVPISVRWSAWSLSS